MHELTIIHKQIFAGLAIGSKPMISTKKFIESELVEEDRMIKSLWTRDIRRLTDELQYK